MKIERIRADLEKARQKAAEWQARAKDLERQLTEQENLEIIQAVRSITASPEKLGTVLGWIRSAGQCAGTPGRMMAQTEAGTVPETAGNPQEPQNHIIKEETEQHEEQI